LATAASDSVAFAARSGAHGGLAQRPPQTAIATGNPRIALATAAELPRVDLADALALCLLLRDDEQRFGRAIVRWHARFCLEVPGVSASEAQLALAALRCIGGAECEAGASALVALLHRHALEDCARQVEQWLGAEPPASPPARSASTPCATPSARGLLASGDLLLRRSPTSFDAIQSRRGGRRLTTEEFERDFGDLSRDGEG